jgi:hypothetical protein
MSPITELIGGAKAYGWGKLLTSGSFDSIATVTVGSGGATTVDFTSIPSNYTHLQIRITARSSTAGTLDGIAWQFNSDTGSNYSNSYQYANGDPTTYTVYGANETKGGQVRIAGDTATSGIFGLGIIDILDYSNTNKFKTAKAFSGDDRNGSGDVWVSANIWSSTNAITSISFFSANGGGRKMMQYSSFALYGIKAVA